MRRFFMSNKNSERNGEDKGLAGVVASYNPEEDPSGAIGHALADAVLKPFDNDVYAYVKSKGAAGDVASYSDVDRLRKYWAQVAWQALSAFGRLQQGEHIQAGEYKDRLSKIDELSRAEGLGYRVDPRFKKMNLSEIRKYFRDFGEKVREKAKEFCPCVVEEISLANYKQRQDSRKYYMLG